MWRFVKTFVRAGGDGSLLGNFEGMRCGAECNSGAVYFVEK